MKREEIIGAVRAVFNPAEMPDHEDIPFLSHDVLVKAYRRSMFLAHPDRHCFLGQDQSLLTERAQEISRSFEVLKAFTSLAPGERERLFATGKTFTRGFGRGGIMPSVPLRLGQYLLNVGAITIAQLLRALQWQTESRPYYGLIAREMSLLTKDTIRIIIASRKKGERFGQCAVRLGLITAEENERVLQRQKDIQPMLGRYFIDRGILTEERIVEHIAGLERHNGRIRDAGRKAH